LHLVRPLGFVLSDQKLRRSAMDYWPRLGVTVHDDDGAFFAAIGGAGAWLLTSKGGVSMWDADFGDGDVLIFGNESRGVSDEVRGRFPGERHVRIPQAAGERCLNLSTAVGIVLYEALRRISCARKEE
jgi:tRNA (cytidine/uridine-2'-O-)-methyltransferase